MVEIIKKTLEVGLGALSVTQEKLKEITDDLVVKGNITRKEGSDFLKELIGIAEDSRKRLTALVEEQVHRVIKEVGIATKSDIKALEGKIERLETLVVKKPARKTTKAKTKAS